MAASNLDNPNHVFVIAEAGSNWKKGTYEEDLSQAKHLIDIAAKCGADAVKFQTYKSHTVYVNNAGQAKYLDQNKTINDIFDYCSMPYEMLNELFEYCQKKKISFMSTPFSIDDASHIDPFVSIHKIASYEINHVRLLQYLVKTRKPLIISTGACSNTEIDFALDIIRKEHDNVALLQCTASYPASIESLNLSVIPKLRKQYDIPVGLSDHSIDPIFAPLLAVGLGATIIEKHFTLDKTLDGPDHYFALEPNELSLMVQTIRNAEKSKGTGIKEILGDEMKLSKFAKRSIQAICTMPKDTVLVEGTNFQVLRPGNQKRGAEPRFLEKIIGKKTNREIKAGEGITLNDVC